MQAVACWLMVERGRHRADGVLLRHRLGRRGRRQLPALPVRYLSTCGGCDQLPSVYRLLLLPRGRVGAHASASGR